MREKAFPALSFVTLWVGFTYVWNRLAATSQILGLSLGHFLVCLRTDYVTHTSGNLSKSAVIKLLRIYYPECKWNFIILFFPAVQVCEHDIVAK